MTSKRGIPSSSFSPPPRKLTYDVFLSFRGDDTRKNFTDHLYAALKRNGIHTFRDDEELERGKSIAPKLFTAIEESRYVIVVLSRNYADSSWCLDEIAKIVECMEEGTIVLPVFYDVDPSDVRKQRGDHFEKAFSRHVKEHPDKVERWRRGLSQVANLSGWHLRARDGYESNVIEEIVQKIFTKLNERISTSEGLVGMDYHLKKMLSYLDIGHPDVRIIGICGMGGIGKTTIAQVVSGIVRPQFDGYSFLENVREKIEKKGAAHLQQKLLSNLLEIKVNVQNTKMGQDIIRYRLCSKRVLIILDDVDQDEQLEALCDREWFGPGSRIIITSRNEHLLSAVDTDEVYNVNPLIEAEALQLFRMKAFKKNQLVAEEFHKLSKEFLKYADGLPLAIKVLGSSVKDRSVELWTSALDRLKAYPEKKIINALKVSFDGLEPREKKIFLDIACFFKGENKDRVRRILQGSDAHCPDFDIQVLLDKSMITLFGSKLWMHDLIQELGWEVVRQECYDELGKRSRLWLRNEIIDVLDQNKATSAVQSILLQGPIEEDVVHSVNDSFSNMDKLRLLKILNVKFSGNIKYLSKKLQFLQWHECPLDYFPSDFQPDNLVELHMHSSRIKQLWKGEKGWRMLRVIDLSGSQYLTSTPDFTQVPDLEILNLEDCTSLVEVNPSLGILKKLICLNMRNCKSVESIPVFTSLESLQTLDLSLCSRLKMFPKIEGNMESLLELNLQGTSIEELPPSFERLIGFSKRLEQLFIGGTAIRDLSFLVGMKNLKSLSCRGCKADAPRSLLSLASLSSLTSLIELDLSYCNLMDGDIPDDLSSLISLTLLDLSGNCFVRLPECFSQLSKLKTLYLRNCRQLELVPKKLPLSLQDVFAEDCTSLTDYPNQVKILSNSVKLAVTKLTTVDSSGFEESMHLMSHLNDGISSELRLKRNMHAEVLSFTLPSQTDSSPQSMSNPFVRIEADNQIPKWFSNTSTSNPISIPIGDNKWKGIATCAVFSVNPTADVEFSNYWYQITLETDVVSLEPLVVDRDVEFHRFRPSSDLRLMCYEPRWRFPKRTLNESTVVRARFETNNPFLVVQKCGIHLAYESDDVLLHLFFHNRTEDTWFTCQNNAVLLSGWLSRGDKCLNWEKFIPPSEEDTTHVLRKNIESVLPRYLEALNHSYAIYKFNLSGSPAWFHNELSLYGYFMSGRPYIGKFVERNDSMAWTSGLIEIPENVHKSKKWMGIAIQASIAVEEKEDNYRVDLGLTTDAGPHFVGAIEWVGSSHQQLLVLYIPRALLPESLFRGGAIKESGPSSHKIPTSPLHWFAETLTTKINSMLLCFLVNNRRVKFQAIGVRVVYEEDIQGFADAIIQCMQRENSLELYDKLVVKDWIELIRLQGGHLEGMSNPKQRDSKTRWERDFELHSQKFRNWDWSAPRHVRCKLYGAEISKWKRFMHIKEGGSAEIPLPPNLLDDANWLGIAICGFSRLCPEDLNLSLGRHTCDSGFNVVTCRLDCDGYVLRKWTPFTELEATGFARDMTWFKYLPRGGKWFKSWRQGKLARVSFSSSSQYLAVQSCALGLVYNKDVEHLVHTLTSCQLP